MGTRMPKDARLLSVNAKGISFVPAGKMRQSASGNLDSGGQAEQSFTDKVGMTTEKILEITTDEIPIRKLELITDGRFTFSPEKRQISVVAKPLPENADRAELIWKVTTDTGIESNLATLSISENQAIVTAQGDGEFLVRCMTKNNTDKIRIISQLAFSVRGLGSATITPYQFVSAGLYDIALGTLTNGNERGIATSNNGDTTFGFTNVDFGDFGSDEVTIPIFALSGDPYPLQIWEGIPGSENCELLADVVYQKPSIWNVYQEETFHLNRRLNGIATICFTAHNKIHVKGFCFAPQKKAWAKLMATENNRIYGDMFTAERDAVTGIGNNVSLEYDQMDFGEKGATRLFLCGRTPLEKNTIHVRFLNENGEESKQIAEFQYSDTYAVQEFALERVTGCNKIIFVFLPGSNFDFQWFYFE